MWPEGAETQTLLSLAKEGDAGAAGRLLERHREAIRRMVSMRMDRAIARRVDSSDIVQEALLEAHRRLADYLKSPALPFHLWLRQIAHDHLIAAHRRHRVAGKRSVEREQHLPPQRPDRSSLELLAQLQAEGLTPAAAAIREELAQRFEAAMHELEDDDREVILMRHHEHLSNGEVAQALGLTQPAASMRYLRAVRRLRALLGEEG
jgi:RNA polymerase sigma-70 factor, ECF subfamily